MKKNDWFEWRKQVIGCRACSNTTKVWLYSLATFADEFGFCFPNQEQIAERMGRDSKRNLERCRKSAEKCGHIVVGHKITQAGKSNNYTLRLTNPHSEDNLTNTNPHSEGTNPHSEGTNPQKDTTNPQKSTTNPHRGRYNTSNNSFTNSFTKSSNQEKKDQENQEEGSWSVSLDDDSAGTAHIDIDEAKRILASSTATDEERDCAWSVLSGKRV
jgi:hypothetical protein